MYCNELKSQGLYYGLKIMRSILMPTENGMNRKELDEFFANKQTFFKKFNENDGFTLLFQTLNALDVKLALQDVVWLSIYQMIASILQLMLRDDTFLSSLPPAKQEGFVKSTSQLVTLCTEVLTTTSEHITLDRDLNKQLFSDEEVKILSEEKVNNIKDEYEILETGFFSNFIGLLECCLNLCPKEFDVFYSSDFIKNGAIINLLAFHPNNDTMKKVADSVVDF